MIRILKKSIDKNTAKFIFLLLIVTLATTGCVSTESPDTTNTDISTVFRPKLPEWVTTPKVQEGVVFGIGGDSDPDNAILESQLDIAFQINTQIKNIVVGRSTADNGVNKNIASSIDEQTTLVTLFGAKIVEKFQSADGQTWILSRMPLNCVMDISQSVMISYALELNMEEEKIAELVKEVEDSLSSERLENPKLENSYKNFNKTVNDNDFQLGKYYERRDNVIKLIAQKRKVIKKRKTTGWTSLITGIIASGAYAYFGVSGDDAYDNYLDAPGTTDAVDYKEQFQLYDMLGYVSLGMAGTGIGLSAISFLSTPSVDDLEIRLIIINKEIALLEGGIQ